MIGDYFRYGIGNLRKQQLRSWLTMMGIFIGMAAVVSLISLGQGLESSINEQFENIGVDKLFVQPKGIFGTITTEVNPLTDKDLDAIERSLGVVDAAGMVFKTAKLEFNDEIRYGTLIGFKPEDPLIEEFYNYDIVMGEKLAKGEKSKVVFGNFYLNDDAFGRKLEIRDKVLVNDIEFKTKGFYETFGNRPDDQSVYLPYDVVRDLYNIGEEYSFIVVKVSGNAEIIAESINRELRKVRGVDERNEDFSIQTPKEIMESFSAILNILQIFLIGIAAISLVVGGIGIMNTMYTAVLERTKEIGIMKSIGARNSDVLMIFLVESGILGLVGGLIGVILGISFSKLVEIIAANAGFSIIKISFPFSLIIGTLVFSFVVGALSGIVPAYKASKLKPVDALRYE